MSYNISNYIQSPFDAVTSEANFLLFSTLDSQIIQLFGVVDAIPEENHQVSVGTTDYPIETGATLTDHAFIKPTQLTLQGYVSDILVGRFTTIVTPFRDREAWERIILQIQKRELVSVVTLLTTYNNMVIEDVTTSKDISSGRSLIFTMRLKQLLIADTQTTKLPKKQTKGAATNKTSEINNGAKQAQVASDAKKTSWASQILNYGSSPNYDSLTRFVGNALSGGV
jgi:hypothetical protein